jgi:hypothetical protein
MCPPVNPWLNTPRKQDRTYSRKTARPVRRWNASLVPGDPRLTDLHVLPEPVPGLHDVPVLPLMANPGSMPGDCPIDRTWITPANWDALLRLGSTPPMYCLDDRAATFPGGGGGATRPAVRWRLAAATPTLSQSPGRAVSRIPFGPPEPATSGSAIPGLRDSLGQPGHGSRCRYHARHSEPILADQHPAPRQLPLPGHQKLSASKSPSPRNLGDGYSIVTAALNR